MSDDQDAVGPQATVEEAREFWRESAKQIVRQSIPAIEESAKQAATIDGLLIGFYVHAVAFADLRGQVFQSWQLVLYISPVCFWLLSTGAALAVFWLKSYTLNIQSSTGAKDTIERIARQKHNRLRVSFIFLVAGILMLLLVLIVYLSG